MADHDGQNNQLIANVGEATAFLWSPTGNSIAILDTNVSTNPYYEGRPETGGLGERDY